MDTRGDGPGRRPSRVRQTLLTVALVAVPVLALATVRPGVVVNGARSPRVWLVLLGVLLGARLLRWLVSRLTGSRSLATGLTAVSTLVVVALLLAPSFRQRTVIEDDPFAVLAAPPTAPVDAAGAQPSPSLEAAAAPRTVAAGQLRGVGHRAEGTVQVQVLQDVAVLRFLDVDIEGTPGPEVHLVPRGSTRPAGGAALGALTAERGTFSYRLPPGWDAGGDVSVLIWCSPFATPVGVADLS